MASSIQLTNDKSTRPGSYWRAGMFWRSHCGGWEHFKSWWNQLDGWFLLGQDFLYTERPEIPVLGQDQQPTDLPGDKDHAIIIYNGILYGILSSSIMEYHHHHYMGYYSNWSDNNYNIMTGWCFGTWLLWLSTIYIYIWDVILPIDFHSYFSRCYFVFTTNQMTTAAWSNGRFHFSMGYSWI